MSAMLERVDPAAALRSLHAAIDALQAVDALGSAATWVTHASAHRSSCAQRTAAT
jgi:hypothetical protein